MGSAILSRYKIPSAAERALLDAPYTVAEPWRLFPMALAVSFATCAAPSPSAADSSCRLWTGCLWL